jgi:hypothetical protein
MCPTLGFAKQLDILAWKWEHSEKWSYNLSPTVSKINLKLSVASAKQTGRVVSVS